MQLQVGVTYIQEVEGREGARRCSFICYMRLEATQVSHGKASNLVDGWAKYRFSVQATDRIKIYKFHAIISLMAMAGDRHIIIGVSIEFPKINHDLLELYILYV